jgi:NAD(P)-dependent dehydrogenase (short-subunit alcohol dehydrogenase family)
MTALPFPLWQVDRQEYAALASYLGIEADGSLYDRLTAYLADAPFRFERPKGFALFLGRLRLTRFRIARLDLTTKLFLPGHPVRHVLNAFIALHECSGPSYRQMATPPTGRTVPLVIAGWMVGFGFSVALTAPWLCWQFLIYVLGMPLRPQEDLAGKRILITGVNRGLGMDLMLHCLEQGAEVIGTVRTAEALAEVQARLPTPAPLRLLLTDLSSPGDLTRSLDQAQVQPGSIDIAILSAAVKHAGQSVLRSTELRDTFQVNLFSAAEFAAWFMQPAIQSSIPPEHAIGGNVTPPSTRTDVHHPRSDRPRTLVAISSMGRWHGMHFSGGYNASKAGLSIWAESLEMEAQMSGAAQLRVLIVEPGLFDSGMTARKLVAKLLFAPRRTVARRVVSGALTGRRSIRPPFWFAMLTWGLCLGGRRLRQRVFARVN